MFKGAEIRRTGTDELVVKTLQSKCRIKDHLIKSLADQLKELEQVRTGSQLLENTSADPIKTFDFDRTTLIQYLKGEEPKDFASSLKVCVFIF